MARVHQPSRYVSLAQGLVRPISRPSDGPRQEPLLPVFDGPFRFEELAAEVRLEIYKYLLPQDLCFEFRPAERSSPVGWKRDCRQQELVADGAAGTRWTVIACTLDKKTGVYHPVKARVKRGAMSLIYSGKKISAEARAVLYGSNTFVLNVDGLAHRPVSMASPLIFGPLGMSERIGVLRDLRNITFNVDIYKVDHWSVKRLRARIEHFVTTIKQYADDEAQKSLLRRLIVRVHRRGQLVTKFMEQEGWGPKNKQYLFAFEPLATLKGVEYVLLQGLESWFGQCLQVCMAGHGGELKTMLYAADVAMTKKTKSPVKSVQSSNAGTLSVSNRKWYQPAYDWKMFAKKNGIPISDEFMDYITS